MPEDTITSELVSAGGDAAAIIDSTNALTLAAAEPQTFERIPDLVRTVTPAGFSENIIDLESYAETPRRKVANIEVLTTASLAQYVNEHRTMGTTLYADPDALAVEAILNDHVPSVTDADAAGHRDHRATLRLTLTPGCDRWLKAHGKYLDQEAFAQLIEDGLTEIAVPSGADLLELAQTMQSSTSAEFRSSIRLTTGQVQFQYVETGTARAGAQGDMTIPETITLVFAPFFGAADMQVEARLRYRIEGGHLKLGVWLIRHVEAIREAFETEVGRLTDLTGDAANDGLVALIGRSSR